MTVPSIVTAVDKNKTRNILKEAFQTVSAITQAGVLNGDFASITDWNLTTSTDPKGIVAYITSKLNYSKQCLTTDITSEGCKRGWTGETPDVISNAHNARWVLPNGAKLQSVHSWSFFKDFVMSWTITAKAYAKDMTSSGANPDTIRISCNITDTTQVMQSISLKPGTCGAFDIPSSTPLNIALGYT